MGPRIRAFTVTVERIAAIAELSQNLEPPQRARVQAGLREAGEGSLADAMARRALGADGDREA